MNYTALKAAAALALSLSCALFIPVLAHAASCDPKELLIKNFNYDRMDFATAVAYRNASSEEWSEDTRKRMAGPSVTVRIPEVSIKIPPRGQSVW